MRNIFKTIIRRQKKTWPVFLVVLFLAALGLAVYGSSGGGGIRSSSLERGLVGHWTMDQSDFLEGTQNVVTNTDLNTGWSQGYQTNIVFNEIDPPQGISSPTVGHDRGNSSGYWYSYGNYAPKVPGQTYTVSLYVKTLDSNFRIRFYTADNSETGRMWGEYITVPNDGKWHRVVWNSFVNPLNSQSDSLSFNFSYAGAIGDPNTRTWFAAPQMEPKGYATPFVIGSRQDALADKTPYGRRGINYGATFVSDRLGQVGKAMYFNGSSNYLRSSNLDFNINGGDWTASAWFYVDKDSPNDSWATVMGVGETYINGFHIFENRLCAYADGSAVCSAFDLAISGRQWRLVTVTHNLSGKIFKIYIDGEEYTTKTYVGTLVNASNRPLTLGWRGSGSNYFTGSIDDVRLYNRALSANEIKLLYDSQQAKLSGRSADGGLVGYWSMDQDDYNSSTQKLSDKTPQTKHGTNYGATFVNDRFGQAGKAMSFNGSSNYIDIGNHSVYDLVDAGSVSVWVKIPSVWTGSLYPNLVSKGASAGWDTNGWSLFIFGNNTVGVGMRNGSTTNTRTFTNTIKDQWTHIVGTWSGSTISVYQDGVLKSSSGQTIKPAVNSTNVTIGRLPNTHYFSGELDEVRIYDKALTLAEVKSLYESHRPQIMSNLQKGLVLDMPLKSDYMKSATILTDRTPYSNDSTLDGAIINDEFTQFNGIGQRVVTPYIQPDDPRNTTWVMNIKILQNNEGIGSFMTGNTGYHSIGFWSYDVGPSTNIRFGFRVIDVVPGAPAGTYVSPSFYPELNRDYHLVGVIDSNSVKLYIDGVLHGSVSHAVSTSMAAVPVVINGNQRISGSSINRGNQYFTASGIRIYHRALSAEEISLLYARGK